MSSTLFQNLSQHPLTRMAIIKPFKHHNNHQIATSPIGEVFRIMAGKNLVPLKYQDTLITFDKTNNLVNWKRQGKSDQWIQTRLENKQVRHQLTSTLQQHGVSQSFHYANCTNAIYQEVLGGTAQQLKEKNGLAKKASLRDNLSRVEVAALGLAEALAEEDIQENQRYGFQQCLQSCDNAGGKVKRALS